MNNILVADKIVKTYNDFTALNNVSISVPKGSIFGLLGPNGAGKTSFIRIINQILLPDSGTIHLDGKELNPVDIRHIGYLPEERGLYKGMRVGEQALYLAQLKGMSKYDAKRRLSYWFEKFEIRDWWGKKVQELSKGMAQKVQFIITVLHQPKLLIFDEPFSGFDPISANLIKDEILQLRDEGASVIFSTHRMESVEEMCDHITLIHESNKILDGKLSDIKRDFKTNSFEVVMHSSRNDFLTNEFSDKIEIVTSTSNQYNDEISMKIKLNDDMSSNDLLELLTSKGSISRFSELIPNANDIFMEAISQSTENA